MKLAEVREILKAEVLCGHERLSEEVNTACGADLMSDVLASKDEKSLLLTGLTNVQVVRTAEVLGDIICIVFVRGKEPGCEILEMADSASIVVMKTDYPLFIACGLLYKNGLNCGSDS
ncbi:DRTGG domain-containing protein [Thermoanaerobacterium sp. CMT5567-10]|uniref:DRTGG domain-containing protein n=1 Tax=Thermoanaerobacterium sp. CMT5567-10 TaxID=3061989 RepID=UPI0026DF1B16|nr:DRTGG domain-containing protein [Thermoanaerobacterium sp. CMT5567-10]WKV08740.1 DRTGG domain-containing protein [Thermoanaerobacterium sp. CMT5567-10]